MRRNVSRGRRATAVEFFNKLYDISGCRTQNEFARACGKKQANVASYLSGAKVPGDKVLASAARHLFEWDIQGDLEVEPVPKNLNGLPDDPGIYVLYDSGGNVLYLGKATSFRTEVRQALGRHIPGGIRLGPKLKKTRPLLKDLATHLSLYRIGSARARHNIEALLLRVFVNQTHNSNIGHLT